MGLPGNFPQKIFRARSTPVVCLHGMEKKGVRFPSGPLKICWCKFSCKHTSISLSSTLSIDFALPLLTFLLHEPIKSQRFVCTRQREVRHEFQYRTGHYQS